jgi:hypothetical protein
MFRILRAEAFRDERSYQGMPRRPTSDNPGAGFPAWEIDFAAELRRLRDQGAGDSAQATMLRIVWLRREFPTAVIDTEAIKIERDLVVIRASVSLGEDGAGSGFAAELTEDHPSLAIALETAETRSIGRALDVLGLILPPDDEPRSKPEPIRQPERARPQPATTPPADPEDPPAVVDALRRAARSQPRSIRPVDDVEAESPAERPANPEVRFTVPTPFPQRPAPGEPADQGDEPALEDVSWTAFWRWARDKGLMRKVDIEQRLGRSIDDLSPAQIRIALRETGIDLS